MSIQDMRDKSEGLVAKFIVGLIIVVFALFGMGSITTFLAPVQKVATVNGVDITQQEMEVEVERTRRLMLAQNRDPSAIDEDQLRQNVLQTLIDRKLLSQATEDLGLQFGNKSLDAEIMATPVFQVAGSYSPDQFQLVIGSAGYSPLRYRQEMRRDKMFMQISSGIRDTSFLTDDEAKRNSRLVQQTRDIAFLRVDVDGLLKDVEVTADEMNQYYNRSPADFMTEETVDIEYLEIKRNDLLDEVEVSDEALQQFFEDTKEIYFEPERRRISHILIEVNDEVSEEQAKQKIDEIYTKITSGADFASLATEYSDDTGSAELGGDLGFNDPESFVEEFEDAAYSLDLNQMSEPVRTEFGYHLLKLSGLEAAKEPVFGEVKEKVETEFREVGAEEIFVSRSARLSEIAYETSDLIEPAEEVGLEIMTTGGVKRDQSIGLAANASVIEAAFSPDVLFDGNNSNLIEITPNHHVVLRVSNHQPQELKALETVSDEVTEAIRLEKATEIAQQQAKEMVEMLESGSITRFVADQYGLEWTVVGEATRNEMEMDREINQQAFGLPRPQEGNKSIGYAILANGDAAVISVTNVVNKPDDEVSGEELSSFARALASQQGQSDYLEFRGNLYAEGTIE